MSNSDRDSDELHPDQAYLIENFDANEQEARKRFLLQMAIMELCMNNGGHIKILIKKVHPDWDGIPLSSIRMEANVTEEAFHFRLIKR